MEWKTTIPRKVYLSDEIDGLDICNDLLYELFNVDSRYYSGRPMVRSIKYLDKDIKTKAVRGQLKETKSESYIITNGKNAYYDSIKPHEFHHLCRDCNRNALCTCNDVAKKGECPAFNLFYKYFDKKFVSKVEETNTIKAKKK